MFGNGLQSMAGLLLVVTSVILALTCAESSVDVYNAAIRGDFERVVELLGMAVDPNFRSEETGYTSLILAVKANNVHVVNLMLSANVDVNAAENDGWTPLHFATSSEHYEIMQLLVEAGATPSSITNNGLDCLTIAKGQEDGTAANLLQDAIANHAVRMKEIQRREALGYALIEASKIGDLAEIRRLVADGANVHATTSSGWCALIFAAGSGDLEILQFLIESGANLNQQEADGWSALAFAAYQGHHAIVDVLIERGANQLTPSKAGLSIVDIAKLNANQVYKHHLGSGLSILVLS
jgi:serine/threonine-protein phosphatase 6 regulatory ankyrin repeat subunit B